MVIDNKKVTIRTENQSEYEEVNEIIYEAFAEQYGIETGKFMMEHFPGQGIYRQSHKPCQWTAPGFSAIGALFLRTESFSPPALPFSAPFYAQTGSKRIPSIC